MKEQRQPEWVGVGKRRRRSSLPRCPKRSKCGDKTDNQYFPKNLLTHPFLQLSTLKATARPVQTAPTGVGWRNKPYFLHYDMNLNISKVLVPGFNTLLNQGYLRAASEWTTHALNRIVQSSAPCIGEIYKIRGGGGPAAPKKEPSRRRNREITWSVASGPLTTRPETSSPRRPTFYGDLIWK